MRVPLFLMKREKRERRMEVPWLSRWWKGSSRSHSCAGFRRSRARASRCFCPEESSLVFLCFRVSILRISRASRGEDARGWWMWWLCS